MSIYLSDWNPRGVRKEWDRCSVSTSDAQRILGDWTKGSVTDACGWFDSSDNLRILVADTDSGDRVTGRITKRHWSIKIEHRAKEPTS